VYRRGSLSWLYNTMMMYSNIAKEGWRAHYEALTEGPGPWYKSEYFYKTRR